MSPGQVRFGWDPFDPTVPLISVGDEKLYFNDFMKDGLYVVISQGFGTWPEFSSNPGDLNSFCFPVYAGRYKPTEESPGLWGAFFVSFLPGNPTGIQVAVNQGKNVCDNPPPSGELEYYNYFR